MRAQWLLLLTLLSIASVLLFLFLLHLHQNPNPNPNPILLSNPLNGAVAAPLLQPSPSPPPPFRLLIGILTRADLYGHRHFLRLIYRSQPPSPIAEIHVKFVFCRLTKEEQGYLVALEILRFDDIVILNCTENMNAGKTHAFLSALPAALPPGHRYDYVMKADDDTYVRLGPLAQSLNPLPRRDLYYGFVLPCASTDAHGGYMSGMGFVLSWDLVEWIAESKAAAQDTVGPEDQLVGRWLADGGKGRNRKTEKPGMYGYPGTNGQCSHDLIPATVAVHRLKRWDRWLHVIEFFNVTKRLKPSKLYIID